MEAGKRILLVEDDDSLGFLLSEFLESEDYKVKWCQDGKCAIKAAKENTYDLFILDVMLPGMDGFDLAEVLKVHQVPYLFLTAKSMKEDKLRGYELGAEDYITKPFDEELFLYKIQVILRRKQRQKEDNKTQFTIGNYHFDYTRQELTYGQEVKRLTEKENEVLRLLCLNKNQILKRDDAVEKIYGKRDYFHGRSFDVFISKIRKYLKEDEGLRIENVFKVGFIFHVPEHQQQSV